MLYAWWCSIHFTMFATCKSQQHISCVVCEYYVLHVVPMPVHHVCCVWVYGVYVFMFWLQTAPHRPPAYKWPSRPWMKMTMLPSWLSPMTPLCVILRPLAR